LILKQTFGDPIVYEFEYSAKAPVTPGANGARPFR
jgi:hypothetical protein